MEVTVEMLKSIAPSSSKTSYKLLPGISLWMNYWCPKYEIDSRNELCHFISQAAHETDSFNTLKEYASGKAYEGRKDLGNTVAGYGVKFKGRGMFQTTGFYNYKALNTEWEKLEEDAAYDFVMDPSFLETPKIAVWSACLYWDKKDFNVHANRPDTDTIYVKSLDKRLKGHKASELTLLQQGFLSPIEYISYRINGGFNGLDERKRFYNKAKEVIK